MRAVESRTLMGAKREPERKRRTFPVRIRYVAALAICAWAFFYFWHAERPQLRQLAAENAKLERQLTSLQAQERALQTEKQQLNNPAYIEKYATEHQNLVMPNTVPFDLQSPSKSH
ncbi:FtsB family cell division protein [Alicyclobacillus sendaiensis]|uniref:Septum formation initiator family protein n=1 Tax=Alicyclobacillus sendaiensis PA2 TaxID=3029425 RepID=A0ABT6Y170_ALISE|nr:septum formation initiator family protein [Alicyclobacillus sendaiensis]MDI9260792.1 septum formation initiator family protein [Alicyclobacillus sendaiensis PA2]